MGQRSRKTGGTPQAEAELLSAMQGSALGYENDDDDDYDEDDPDLADLNNPDVQILGEPPLIGGRPHSSMNFGEEAHGIGRASSPKLWASATQFPSAVQFRVWRMENGVPAGLGSIDIEATEEDFVRSFIDAMPQPGHGKYTFLLRPINIRGKELGQEVTVNISEHHGVVKQLREQRKREEQEGMGGGYGRGGDVIVQGGGGDSAGALYAEEMGRMYEQAVESRDEHTRLLQAQLEAERRREREASDRLAQERVSAAERSTSVVEKMTEKLMATDQARAQEALNAQKETSQVVMTTLTTTFQQQQEAARLQAERQRELDLARTQQDREFFERQRQEVEMRRAQEREEAERRRREEKEEWDRRLERDRQEAERKAAAERADLEHRREQLRLEAEQRRVELEERRRQESQEWERKQALAREEMERRERLDRERWEREKIEMVTRTEKERQEAQARAEREKLEWEQHKEETRREDERRERERNEAAERREAQRKEELILQQRALEVSAQKDREHAERMMEMARLEREAQREAALMREKGEREARESSEAERQRRHELLLREMEMQKERDREHAERMLQMHKAQNSGGLSGITDMLGMDTPELLGRIFGGSGDSDKGWAETLGPVLGGLGELAKAAMAAKNAEPAARQVKQAETTQYGRQRVSKGQQMVAIQTEHGTRLIPASDLSQLQRQQLAAMERGGAQPIPVQVRPDELDLPAAPYRPAGMEDAIELPKPVQTKPRPAAAGSKTQTAAVAATPVSSETMDKLRAGGKVNCLARAKDADIPFSKQRAARRNIRELIETLDSAEEEEWLGHVTAALTKNPGIYYYLKAVTVYAALHEAKVDPSLAERFIKALKESGMVPEDALPFDEADFARQQQADNKKDGAE